MLGIVKQAALALAASAAFLPAAPAHAASHESPSSSGTPNGPKSSRTKSSRSSKALRSPQLWATVDICKTGKTPLVGIRGSMPSDGKPHDTMYMRFGVQYLDGDTGKWAYLPKGEEESFTKVGYANATRQAGRNFRLGNPPKGQSFELRGLIEFQWRHHSKVVLTALRPTTSGHKKTVLHAQPRGFSAASCKLG